MSGAQIFIAHASASFQCTK